MTNKSASEQHDCCTLCGKNSEYKCHRCEDSYCSEICQKKDWPNHRFICFPIPKLVKVGQCSISKDCKKDSQPDLVAKDTKSLKNTNVLPSGSCILLTAFKSPNRCFIRSTNPSTTAEYNLVLNEINEFGKKSAVLSQHPKTNSLAVTLRGDKWSRVKILGKNRDSYRIVYTDFGDLGQRSLKDLRNLAPPLANLPSFLHLVQLKGITYIFNQQKSLNSLTQFTNKEYKIEFVEPDKMGGNVELFHWGTTTSLNSLIQTLSSKPTDNGEDTDLLSVASTSSNANELKIKDTEMKTSARQINKDKSIIQQSLKNSIHGNSNKQNGDTNTFTTETKEYANKVETSVEHHSANKRKTAALPRQIQMQNPCLVPPFEIIPINEDDVNCNVMIMDNSYIESGYIGCLLEKHCENLKEISKFLKQYNVSDQAYKPKFNEYCLANYENEWYRAKVVEINSEDKFLVVYIDFTNEMELTSASIRRYPMSLNLPCCTTLCAIDGLPKDISAEIKNFLELNCADFTPLSIDSVRIQDDIRYIKSNELLNKLHDSKLL